MLPHRVSNPGPLTYESAALPTALRGLAQSSGICRIYSGKHRKCSVIIDCCEVLIERAGNINATVTAWSNYKHNNTIKYLVGITPTGAASFVSKVFGGGTSDTVVAQRSGFLDFVEREDQILPDRGF